VLLLKLLKELVGRLSLGPLEELVRRLTFGLLKQQVGRLSHGPPRSIGRGFCQHMCTMLP